MEIVEKAISVGYKKAFSTSWKCETNYNSPISPIQSIIKVMMKAMMSGAYLGFTISLAISASSESNGWDKVSATILFPMGFVMLILMGNDLATGNFGNIPISPYYFLFTF